MKVFGHSTQSQTLHYLCIQEGDVKDAVTGIVGLSMSCFLDKIGQFSPASICRNPGTGRPSSPPFPVPYRVKAEIGFHDKLSEI